MGMCGQCNPHVYSKMTKEGIITSRNSASAACFSQYKNEMKIINGRREFISLSVTDISLSVVYQHSGTVDTQAILQMESGFPRDFLSEGRVPRLASLPTPRVNEVYILFFLKHIGFHFQINVF